MKALPTIALTTLAFTACKKEDKQVQYAVVCDRCHVEYVDRDERWQKLTMSDTAWSMTFDTKHNGTARLEVRHVSSAVIPSIAVLKVDGGEPIAATTNTPGATIVVKD